MTMQRNAQRLEPLDGAPSLSERVYGALKDAIQSLRFRPGEMLAIGNLADQLGVSRTPVRDALMILEREGLVTIIPQKGAYVSLISARDVEEIYELRIVLESYAARVATARITPEDLDLLTETLRTSAEVFEHGQGASAVELGHELHELLVSKVDNERLVASLNDLEVHYSRLRHIAADIPHRFERSNRQHHAILAALRDGDAERASQALTDHLTSVRDDILSSLGEWTARLEQQDPPLSIR